jgi:NADPH:quinone reductase-like Zn-dependent oxidoreductase
MEVAMEAIQFTRFGPPDVLDLIDVPTPKATDGKAVVVRHRRPRRPVDCNKEV